MYCDVFFSDTRLLIINNDDRSTYSSTIARYMDCVLVMVDVYAYELAEHPGSSKFPELRHETIRKCRETYDGTIHIYDKG
jgi:hypothetical protein